MINKSTKKHFDIIDVTRGFAIALMFIYHFCYDLNYFGYIQEDFIQGTFWVTFRTIIVTLFLTVMGISLYLASYSGISKKRFRQRLVLLIFYSSLVSLSSWFMFPKAMVFFGILHFIVIASLLGLLFIRLGRLNLFLGLGLIIAGQTISSSLFSHPLLQWFGLMTKPPITVDYVPLIPWFGVVLVGIYLGQILSQQPKNSFFVQWQSSHPTTNLLALGGRYSLHIYMLHQPLFLGILYIISQIFV